MTTIIKPELRKNFLTRRLALTSEELQKASAVICNRLQGVLPASAKIVAAYYPIKNELNILPFLESRRQEGSITPLPTVSEGKLIFRPFTNETRLIINTRLGITEPSFTEPEIGADEIDAFLIPCVAASMGKYRLGYGGGYYDRMLGGLRLKNRKFMTIGILQDDFLVETLPSESHDVPLDLIITEKRTI